VPLQTVGLAHQLGKRALKKLLQADLFRARHIVRKKFRRFFESLTVTQIFAYKQSARTIPGSNPGFPTYGELAELVKALIDKIS
jgi:hypothetical protein